MTEETLKKNIGDYLKLIRLKAGLTQSATANKLKFGSGGSQFVSNWERGTGVLPPSSKLNTLAKIYKVSPITLVETIFKFKQDILTLKFKKIRNSL